jgi:hypothetical protein
MRNHSKIVASLLVATLALGLASGCGQLPTAPAAPEQNQPGQPSSSQLTINRDATDGASTTHGILGGTPAGSPGTVGTIIGGAGQLITRTVNSVDGAGASLSNGRWRVEMPAGCVNGNVTIGIGIPLFDGSTCHLSITPEDKNHFDVPARLTVNCSNVPVDQLRTYRIWLHKSDGKWKPVDGSTVDLQAKTVSAPLKHFSEYSVGSNGGRAGW